MIQTVPSTQPHLPATSWVPPFPGEPVHLQIGFLLLQRLSSLAH